MLQTIIPYISFNSDGLIRVIGELSLSISDLKNDLNETLKEIREKL